MIVLALIVDLMKYVIPASIGFLIFIIGLIVYLVCKKKQKPTKVSKCVMIIGGVMTVAPIICWILSIILFQFQ